MVLSTTFLDLSPLRRRVPLSADDLTSRLLHSPSSRTRWRPCCGSRQLGSWQAVPRIFSAGLDITEMYGKSAEHYAEFWRAVQEMWLKLYGSSMVTVAAINGSSPAGGCLMAMSCDYRIMADNKKYSIGLNETQLGIVAPFWFKDVMLEVVGHRVAERSLQLGLLYSPTDALKIGLLDEIVAEDKVQSTASAVMAQCLALPDHARQLTKSMMRKPTLDRLVTHRESDIKNFVSFITRDSIQKSLQMYMEMLKKKSS
ncbi:enoyl-CoA delta isomerase 1, mitochondrial isoform X3 [Rhinatrema bivittatum]|nr:enoyl-CoA delta isomerase 1, mitochondrial isoform X3 [Rhinatrema bivittatum]XP_029432147.1 enoyl-CoA delta isomerase 1, mitochondrial isoform X3 [Rhinatrema bivittatum]XP_029432148.1 enoyl-CoA delta isomerase 1, mitochondrial isoform X3 [Rhinatrema bivittatum]XP_029432149.1 enoyl-CoA delta isomerase 1, mitochondrial isoform X3 [Rhinatrema bivittatum]